MFLIGCAQQLFNDTIPNLAAKPTINTDAFPNMASLGIGYDGSVTMEPPECQVTSTPFLTNLDDVEP